MRTTMRGIWNDATRAERLGGRLLLGAGLVVALAIAADGDLARRINGVSGVLWIAAAALLLRAARGAGFARNVAIVLGLGLVIAYAVSPSDLLWAVGGFGVMGAIVALATGAGGRGALWAKVLPALWLPLHLTLALGAAVLRELRDDPAALRRDPPPTTAFVPFAMIVAAWGAGLLVQRWRSRRVAS
jgi:hypothetical protein